MAIVMMDSWAFCRGREVAASVAERSGYRQVEEDGVLQAAAEICGIDPDRLRRMIYGPSRILDSFGLDRPKAIAALRLAVSDLAADDDEILVRGGVSHVAPTTVGHVLRVCLGGHREYRIAQAADRGVVGREAERSLRRDDEARAGWVEAVRDRDFRDPDLYDVFVAMHDSSPEAASAMIVAHLANPAVARTPASEEAASDVRLAARVQLHLASDGHDVDVTAADGVVTVLINRHTMFLDRLQRQLVDAASSIEGVRSAIARPGPRYREPSVAWGSELDLPRKVLLVDDEQDFVHTLSERLQTRRMSPTVAYDGEQALEAIESDEPEVMVLDLKMPGIDGIEVLRRVKREHPRTEVIILTGHGSDAEERLASELGAFAYLRKPVDIELLTQTMQQAYQRVAEVAARGAEPEAP